MPEPVESRVDVRYGIAGKAAGEAALEHGRDGARLRPVTDAFVLSRIARAVVDALAEHDADERKVVAVDALLAALPDGVTRGQVRSAIFALNGDCDHGYKAAGGTTTCPACEHNRVWGDDA